MFDKKGGLRLGGDRSGRLRLIRKEQSDRLSFMIGRLSRGVETSVHCFLKTGFMDARREADNKIEHKDSR